MLGRVLEVLCTIFICFCWYFQSTWERHWSSSQWYYV